MKDSVKEQHISGLLELLPDFADEKIMEQAWSGCVEG